MKEEIKFRIRGRTGYAELPLHVLNELVNPYEESDESFLEEVLRLHKLAKETETIQEFGGGGLLDLFILPNGVLYLGRSVMCLDMVIEEASKNEGDRGFPIESSKACY